MVAIGAAGVAAGHQAVALEALSKGVEGEHQVFDQVLVLSSKPQKHSESASESTLRFSSLFGECKYLLPRSGSPHCFQLAVSKAPPAQSWSQKAYGQPKHNQTTNPNPGTAAGDGHELPCLILGQWQPAHQSR